MAPLGILFFTMDLSRTQQEAVAHTGGPLLIVAGAGSGKTRTLTSRVIALITDGVPPEHILAITFTNKAAHEMRDRITPHILEYKKQPHRTAGRSGGARNSGEPFIGTFHALGARILRRTGGNLGRTAGFSIFDKNDSLRVVRGVIKTMGIQNKIPKQYGPLFFAKKISLLKNNIQAPAREASSDNRADTLVPDIFDAYERALTDNNAFDFDDLIEKPVRILSENKSLLTFYRNIFRHIFVDEYQDINTAQYLLVTLLAKEHQNISVVGDDAQAIYSFRGADFRNFLNFEKDWPNSKTIILEENYRSTAHIINAASALMRNNTVQKQKTLWTHNAEGEPIRIMETEDEEDEARVIVALIRGLISDGVRDIAILYRTNAQSRPLEQEMIFKNIPYHIFGGLKFYERMEVRDIISALTIAHNPSDSLCRERIEKRLPKYRRGDILEHLPSMSSLSPTDIITNFINATQYGDYLRQHYANYEERIENIAELASFAETFSSLGEFLERVSLLDSSVPSKTRGGLSNNAPVVNLATIHLAKGLEFNSVFVSGCTEGTLPHRNALISKHEIEEERRLMYVAMTRAKERLFLSFYDTPSRFLTEIPSHHTNMESMRSARQEEMRPLDDEERYIVYE